MNNTLCTKITQLNSETNWKASRSLSISNKIERNRTYWRFFHWNLRFRWFSKTWICSVRCLEGIIFIVLEVTTWHMTIFSSDHTKRKKGRWSFIFSWFCLNPVPNVNLTHETNITISLFIFFSISFFYNIICTFLLFPQY